MGEWQFVCHSTSLSTSNIMPVSCLYPTAHRGGPVDSSRSFLHLTDVKTEVHGGRTCPGSPGRGGPGLKSRVPQRRCNNRQDSCDPGDSNSSAPGARQVTLRNWEMQRHTLLKGSHFSGHRGLVGIRPHDAKYFDFSREIPIFM